MFWKRTLLVLALLVLAVPSFAEDSAFQVMQSGEFGPYLADPAGRALYYHTKDRKDVSTCMGRCKATWPMVQGGPVEVEDNLKASDFGSFRYVRGPLHMTFRGAPLYTYVGDKAEGDTFGHGMGNAWSLIDPETYVGMK